MIYSHEYFPSGGYTGHFPTLANAVSLSRTVSFPFPAQIHHNKSYQKSLHRSGREKRAQESLFKYVPGYVKTY